MTGCCRGCFSSNMALTYGCIYYTDNRPKQFILDRCQKTLRENCPYPIVAVSLHKPVNLGENCTTIILNDRERSYPTMIYQQVIALEKLDTDIVYFLEHDVLYHPSHFNYTPPTKEIYYYNINNYRWSIKEDFAVTYDGLHSLSMLCCYRETALAHFKARLKYVEDNLWEATRSREPRLGRTIGYEPGTKPKRRGGFSDETFVCWRSEFPNIDIRHRNTFSSPKTTLEEFKHPPTNWKEERLEDIPYWNMKELQTDWVTNYGNLMLRW